VTNLTLTVRHRAYPVVLPSVRDARLHVAAVIMTIHVLGQLGLQFQVSIPQILAAIVTSAVLEVAITFRARRAFVWPASAMLTGSGVALILRVPGTPRDEPWSTQGWYFFAGVAALSLLTKYAIRFRGSHLFNPSNLGLVVAFLVLGSTRVEPLDFWWAPLEAWMLAAYAVILTGGLLITARLRLLGMAVTFWASLAVAVGIIAATGHCMTARWAFAPVCGFDYWRVIVTSPEVLIFLFFMITDPKTVPAGRSGRLVFGALVAVASTLAMATQTTEFGTKVALLSGLVVVCGLRPLIARLPAASTAAVEAPARGRRRAVWSGAVIAAGVAFGGALVAAESLAADEAAVPSDVVGLTIRDIDPSTLPAITVERDVSDWNHEIAGRRAHELVLDLVENLELENQALLTGDATILPAVDHGDRLEEMRARIERAEAEGVTTIERHRIDAVAVRLLEPFGAQTGLSLGLDARGTVVEETYDRDGDLLERVTAPFATTFAVRQVTGGRWLNVGVVEPEAAG
jgi:Na+-translocating ferredoxin:NAD+ oxidoreductase RnfD subunit